MIDLSIVIPAHNEEGVIEQTVSDLALRITREGIVNEIVVVNDNSTDQTDVILEQLRQKIKNLKVVDNPPPYGFGFAVRRGIEETGGNHIAIMMADASDDPEDLICFFRNNGIFSCVMRIFFSLVVWNKLTVSPSFPAASACHSILKTRNHSI